MDGHFVLMINPDETVDTTKILKKRVVFLLDKSSSMFGFKLDQSKDAITQCLDLLQPEDYFNIVTFDYYVNKWQTQLMPANASNIQSAKSYLAAIQTISWGSNLEAALQQTLPLFTDKNLCNSMLLFTDGFSAIDPIDIENRNPYKAGIFCIGIGEELDRAKLELLSFRNYGFVTYFDETDNLILGINRVFNQINRPVLMDTNFEFGRCDAYNILPQKYPSVYQGNRFFITGRYKNPGTSAFSIAGTSVTGLQAFDFLLDFASATHTNKFVQSIWAKEMIDDIERQIAIFGETDSLKNLDIELSLKYNIRCKYTAYIADYETKGETKVISARDNVSLPKSYLIGNYPNPFNSSTVITIYLDQDALGIKYKFLRIYNLLGQLVAVIDLSHLGPGMHTIKFEGRDNWGNELPSGIYICQLVAGKEISTIRISLVK
jgi:Ca-activated chloride channel family protein